MKTRFSEWLIALAILSNLGLARANTITVTSTADNGAGSLRDSLASAADGDTIDATGVSGTILLTGGELLVTNSVIILGPGPNNLAVDGNAASRVFHISSNTFVSISSLTITNGFVTGIESPADIGGGIYNDGATLALNNCHIVSNASIYTFYDDGSGQFYGVGGGIYTRSGSLNLNTCFLSGNVAGLSTNSGGNFTGKGGGIYSDGTVLVISNSTLSANSSHEGGAISLDGASLQILNCTFSENSAEFEGGAILNASTNATIIGSTFSNNSAGVGFEFGGSGGAIDSGTINGNEAANLEILNCTFSGNAVTADGGAIWNGTVFGGTSVLYVANCTFQSNSAPEGGTIANSGNPYFGGFATVSIGSTILNAGLGGSISNTVGTVTSLGYNLSSDDGGGALNQPTDMVNKDPLLGPLQDNGGSTFTHALLPGSPAIDQGNNFSGIGSDQRGKGYIRTYDDPATPNAVGGDGTDIGAFELQPSNQPPVAECKNVSVPAGPGGFASASIDGGSFDPDPGDTITLTQAPAGPYAVGDTTVTLTVTDNHGASDYCTATVHVQGAAEQIHDLIALVQNLGLPSGTANSLIVKLQAAANALDRGNTRSACGSLGAFLNEVNAQKSKKLTTAQADSLLAETARIRTVLNCP